MHVVYGLIGLKTHCKVALVVRREKRSDPALRPPLDRQLQPQHRAHLHRPLLFHGARRAIADDATALFNLLTGYSSPPSWKRFAIAPLGLQERIIALIDREAGAGRRGPDHRQDERAGRRPGDQGALSGVPGGRVHRSHRARHLLPAPGRARDQREHPGDQHRRSLPRARAHLLFPQRRQARRSTCRPRTGCRATSSGASR